MGSKSAGFEQAACDVVREVEEAEGRSSEVFESPVDRFGRSIAGAGAVEERQDVRRSLFEGAAELADLGERRGDTASDAVDHGAHHGLAFSLVGLSCQLVRPGLREKNRCPTRAIQSLH